MTRGIQGIKLGQMTMVGLGKLILGGGFVTCFEAVRTLIELGLRPKRTIRFVTWSGEEEGEVSFLRLIGKVNNGAV